MSEVCRVLPGSIGADRGLSGQPRPGFSSGTCLPSDPTTFRSPSGSSSCTVRWKNLAILMQMVSGHGFSVTVTFTWPSLSTAFAV